MGIIHSYCRGDTMLGKGCTHCVLNELNVCNEGIGGAIVPLERLREAEKVIGEVVQNECVKP
jgi:hypothetical protein